MAKKITSSDEYQRAMRRYQLLDSKWEITTEEEREMKELGNALAEYERKNKSSFKTRWALMKMSDREWLTQIDAVLESMVQANQGNTKPRDRMPVDKAVDAAFAGPVPISLLARQDLEGEETSSRKGMETEPGVIEETLKSGPVELSNQLDHFTGQAQKVDTPTQKHDLVSRIKENQLKQQNSILSLRKK